MTHDKWFYWNGGRPIARTNITANELYQAFRDRFIEELNAAAAAERAKIKMEFEDLCKQINDGKS